MSLSKFEEIVKDREACAAVPEVAESQTGLSNRTITITTKIKIPFLWGNRAAYPRADRLVLEGSIVPEHTEVDLTLPAHPYHLPPFTGCPVFQPLGITCPPLNTLSGGVYHPIPSIQKDLLSYEEKPIHHSRCS